MAKVTHEKPVDRRQVVKARRLIHYKGYKGKPDYAQKWPKPRGPVKKPRPKAWVEHFVKWAHWSKQPDPCAVATSSTLAPTTGYWPRDIIHRAGNGKINHHRPNVPLSSPLPYLFMRPPNKRYEGPPRVITPTTRLTRSGSQSRTAFVEADVIPNVKTWDNNTFWDSASHPERLTFRADGLYFIYANLQFTGGSNYGVHAHFEDQAATWYGAQNGQNVGGWEAWIAPFFCYYFYAGQWVKLRAAAGANCNVNLKELVVMAITPETLI